MTADERLYQWVRLARDILAGPMTMSAAHRGRLIELYDDTKVVQHTPEEPDDDDLDDDPCPVCGSPVDDGPGGGVVCSSPTCTYWYCF